MRSKAHLSAVALATTTETAAKTSVLKFFRVFSKFYAIISTRLKCQMQVNFPGIEFLETDPKQKVCCTCRIVVLLNKPVAFFTSSLPLSLSLLELPNMARPGPITKKNTIRKRKWRTDWDTTNIKSSHHLKW